MKHILCLLLNLYKCRYHHCFYQEGACWVPATPKSYMKEKGTITQNFLAMSERMPGCFKSSQQPQKEDTIIIN